MFRERKAAQVAAWFLRQQGGRMPHLKLIKLMYLADREAMAVHGFPITGDQVVAMPHGPVLSMTLNYINGDIESGDDGWECWVRDRDNHEVSLEDRPVDREQLDELSAAELDSLGRVWQQFGMMSKWQLRDHTHQHCPEWQDPQGSSIPISYKRIFQALGRSEQEATRLAQRLEDQRSVDRVINAL
jgi:uncharacterized phage-associated protein